MMMMMMMMMVIITIIIIIIIVIIILCSQCHLTVEQQSTMMQGIFIFVNNIKSAQTNKLEVLWLFL